MRSRALVDCLHPNPNSSLTRRATSGQFLRLSFLICERGALMFSAPTSDGRREGLRSQYKNIKCGVNRAFLLFLFSTFYNALISWGALDPGENCPVQG